MARTQVGSSEHALSSARPKPPRRRLGPLVTVGFVAACGSADGDSLYGPPSTGGREPGDASAAGSPSSEGGDGGGAGGRATGGARATGGRAATGGAQAGGNGGKGAGGASGGNSTGGAAGSGGVLVDAGPECEAPSIDGQTALCVHFIPERIRALAEAKLDKMGILVVQVFDGPTPPGSATAPVNKLAEQAIPGNGEISVDALPMVRLEAAFPETVYLRAVFLDNQTALAPDGEGYGVWLGGFDLSIGVVDPQPIAPLSVAQGTAQDVDLALVALRRLEVRLNLEVTPKGDGEGPLVVTAFRTDTPTTGTPFVGIAGAACAKSSPGPVSVTGYLIGSGAFYLGALLNDLGATGTLPPGSLVSLDSSGPGGSRLPTRVTVAPMDYSTSVVVPLNAMIPLPNDPMIPPNSCADMGL